MVGTVTTLKLESATSNKLGTVLSETLIKYWLLTTAGGIQLAYLLAAGAVPMLVHVAPLLIEYSNLTVVTELYSHSTY